jgi:putative methylase
MLISSLKDIPDPKPKWEQYVTPSRIVCDILFEVNEAHGLTGKHICELGCGPGPFALGAWILGSESVTGIDIDPDSIEVAKSNHSMLLEKLEPAPDGRVTFIQGDINDPFPVKSRFDMVFMNPPFGAQNKHADRPFIERAMDIAPICYSIHNGNSLDFLKKMSRSMDIKASIMWKEQLEIPARYYFHRKEKADIEILIMEFRTR